MGLSFSFLTGVKTDMKFIKQFGIIIFISLLGELLKMLLPFPIPASIYGLVLMLFSLCTGILSLESVKETSLFLIDIMPLMFIPAAVQLLEAWSVINPILLPLAVITVLSTVVVMAVSGRTTQYIIRRGKKGGESK